MTFYLEAIAKNKVNLDTEEQGLQDVLVELFSCLNTLFNEGRGVSSYPLTFVAVYNFIFSTAKDSLPPRDSRQVQEYFQQQCYFKHMILALIIKASDKLIVQQHI
ncbi:hypothetical protein A0J61_03882 [Choanephora cucurbitarum]|uniref:Uncharacterized protein n=1 Tax=Choanephora cucurbitarum TaxID=101091 RepID=A0A1C7NG21_9FUNG|nr:hypothetical protein A0J61_03882 [Choanephora cucurbitarum]